MSVLDYFQTLGIHPELEPLESLTGYLTRLAELNRIDSYQKFSFLSFSTKTKFLRPETYDFPLLPMKSLSHLSSRSLAELQVGTFYHLGAKFGRWPYPQGLGRFLNGSLSEHLRYCPNCLKDKPYYRLYWRFLALNACPQHRCELLNLCWNCQRPISLFKAPFRIGFCQNCNADLRYATMLPIGDDYWDAKRVVLDLIFLLTPQNWESPSVNIIKVLGKVLQFLRLRKGSSINELGNILKISESKLIGIEQATILKKRGRFSTYLAYSNFLGHSLWSLFTASLMTEKEDWDYESYIKVERQRKVKEALQDLQVEGTAISYSTITANTGIPRADLIFDKELNQLIVPFLDDLNSDSF
jgi:transcriptional regulator with XRE-family HTH domain